MSIIDQKEYDAVLFDMDGVLTATAKVHSACWKRLFDDFLRERSGEAGTAFHPFEIATDYKQYVDGKLRYDGVRSFLASRGIELPEGRPEDAPGSDTICALGNRKNALLKEVLQAEGVDVYEGAVPLVQALHARGIKTAVVSASKNCRAILQAGDIAGLFDHVVDGCVAAEFGLPGKPSPDTFLKAAELLNVTPQRAVVVEDAVSGVQAGRDGGFGLVVGVDRTGQPEALRQGGAHVVISELNALMD